MAESSESRSVASTAVVNESSESQTEKESLVVATDCEHVVEQALTEQDFTPPACGNCLQWCVCHVFGLEPASECTAVVDADSITPEGRDPTNVSTRKQ